MMISAQQWTGDERTENMSDALAALGLDSSAKETGDGIVCVVIPHTDGSSIPSSTADIAWGK